MGRHQAGRPDRRDRWANAREEGALRAENTGSSSGRRGAIFGRWLRGEVRKADERAGRRAR